VHAPRFSPDGTHVAFVSNDEGNPEIYVMPATGGTPQRVTFLGSTMVSTDVWSADGTEIFFVANAGSWYERETRPMASTRRRTVRELGLGHAKSFSFGPREEPSSAQRGRSGALEALSRRHRGEIWIDATGSGEFERLKLPDGNPTWPMWIASASFFSPTRGIGTSIPARSIVAADVTRQTHEGEY